PNCAGFSRKGRNGSAHFVTGQLAPYSDSFRMFPTNSSHATPGLTRNSTLWTRLWERAMGADVATVVIGGRGRRRRVRRKFPDSPLEQAGFELVWGFSCQVVLASSLFGGVSR